MRTKAVAEAVQDGLDQLRPAERRVARALLADYPRAGLDTTASLAREAGVSPPTVVRFALALGYEGFAGLQQALRDEIAFRAQGPLGHEGWDRSRSEAGYAGDLRAAAGDLADAALATVDRLPQSEWEAAVALMCERPGRIVCVGGRYTASMSSHLAVSLEMLRPGVQDVTDPFGEDAGSLVDLGRRDLLVAFDIPRYQYSTIEAVALARRRRAAVVLVTDSRLSPAAANADVVLPVSVDSPSPFAGLTASMMLVELLVLAVVERLGENAQRRISEWEALRRHELADPRA